MHINHAGLAICVRSALIYTPKTIFQGNSNFKYQNTNISDDILRVDREVMKIAIKFAVSLITVNLVNYQVKVNLILVLVLPTVETLPP